MRALFDVPYWDINPTPKVFPAQVRQPAQPDLRRRSDRRRIQRHLPSRTTACWKSRFFDARHGGKSTTRYGSAFRMYVGAYRLWQARKQAR
ncbi:MAG: hypothetical protein U0703_20140 [Anaerolineae bacterium]